jgi:hypothetical protein
MRIRKRYAIALAVVAAGGLAIASLALGAATSTFTFKTSPSTAPKTTYKSGSLYTDLETHYTNPGNGNPGGAVERTQIFLDKNFKVNPNAAKTCAASSLSGQTMKGAMAHCKTALVGSGKAQAVNPATKKPVYACVLLFNGKPQAGKPTLQVFTRVDITGKVLSCANPGSNTGGQTTVLLTGVYKNASGLYGKVLDVNNITKAAAFPLTSYKTTVKHGNYASARCAAANHLWHVKVVWTYNNGQSSSVSRTQKCTVG